MLQLRAGTFFGGARLERRAGPVSVSQRLAEGAPDSVGWHRHEDAHFILVRAGAHVSLATGVPPAGPLLIYNPPGTIHRDHFRDGRGSFCAISLAPATAAEALAALRAPDAPCVLAAPAQQALALRIAAQCAADTSPLTLEALALELLASVAGPAPGQRAAPGWLPRALELLHDRPEGELTVATVARAVGVHPVHLTRTFRQHLRCTPGAFVRYRRLDRAAALLAGAARPLAEVALECGFADQSHLGHTFRRFFGVAPGEYRRLAGNGRSRPRFAFDKTAAAARASVAHGTRPRRARAEGDS